MNSDTKIAPASIENEMDLFTHELSRAVGLGGRELRTASVVERARLDVTGAIKSAIDKIAEKHPELAMYLKASITIGSSCSHVPDPTNPVEWRF